MLANAGSENREAKSAKKFIDRKTHFSDTWIDGNSKNHINSEFRYHTQEGEKKVQHY